MTFVKGDRGNPLGRPKGGRLAQMVRFDLKQAARAHCEEALEVIARCMRSDDERVRLMAANIMLERGYGKPEQKTDAEVVHRFALVPEVMEKDEWLKHRGQPQPKALPPPDPDRKLN
jgi:hypothetical protein